VEETRAGRQPAVPSNGIDLTDRFSDALQLAFDLHRDQRRKGSGIPYVAHLLAVAALVIEDGGDEDEAIAALLHDAVEDQGHRISLAVIREEFSPRVAEIVERCTDTAPDHSGGEKEPWLDRKRAYLEHLRGSRPELLRVSLADKVHNARSILADLSALGDPVFERFTGRKHNTLWYYRALVVAFREAGAAGWLADEFERTVREIERLAGHPGGVHEPVAISPAPPGDYA
jgi:(p)ppGpp synthase/HD superfamily hydrolase